MTATAQALLAVVVGEQPPDAQGVSRLGAGVTVETISSAALPGRLGREPPPDVVVVLPDVAHPVGAAQLVGGVDQDTAVILLAEAGDCAPLDRALQLAPFIGTHVQCLEAPAVGDTAVLAARQTRERRRHRADMAAAADRLVTRPPAPPAHPVVSLVGVLEATAIGIVILDEHDRIARWTGPAARLLGAELTGRAIVDLLDPGERPAAGAALRRRAGTIPDPIVVKLAGRERYAELTPSAYTEPDGGRGVVVLVADATERVRVDRTRQRVEREQRFLAEAGAVLDASLDLDETLERIARLAVPDIGELCVIDRFGVQESPPATVVAADPGVAEALSEVRARWPMRPESEHPAARVMRSGSSELLAEVPAADLERYAQSAEHLALMRRLHYRSAIVTPLVARGRTHGALSVLRLADRTPYEPADLKLIETLGARAAMALDNAWLYERERRIAATLQAALLPTHLPELDGAQIAGRYRPAADGLEVGGDWYDVIPLGDQRVGLAIGDVVGRGLHAAAVMGQLRNFLRAHALDHDDPARTVDQVARLMTRFDVGDFATLVYAIVDLRTGDVQLCSAGHPPAVLIAADGSASLVDAQLPPLAAGLVVERRAHRLHLEPGGALLLYTDGLVERRSEPIDAGLARLLGAVSDPPDDLDELCDRILARTSAPEATSDDRALLLVRRSATARPVS